MPPTSMLRILPNVIIRRNSICCLRSVSSVCFNNINSVQRTPNIYFTNLHVHNRMMATAVGVTNIGIDELKTYQKNIATIIDVREPDEIKETGILPGAFNIPLGEVGKALQDDPNTFQKKYNHAKPQKDSPIIFSCRSGKRSLMAAQTAESLGFTNSINFAGGWLEWEKNLPK